MRRSKRKTLPFSEDGMNFVRCGTSGSIEISGKGEIEPFTLKGEEDWVDPYLGSGKEQRRGFLNGIECKGTRSIFMNSTLTVDTLRGEREITQKN
jgi:hypothetical protein